MSNKIVTENNKKRIIKENNNIFAEVKALFLLPF